MLGLILHQQHKDDDAKAALEKAAELAPDNFSALDKLVELDLAAKHYDAASERSNNCFRRIANTAAPHFLEAKIYSAQARRRTSPRAESALRESG